MLGLETRGSITDTGDDARTDYKLFYILNERKPGEKHKLGIVLADTEAILH